MIINLEVYVVIDYISFSMFRNTSHNWVVIESFEENGEENLKNKNKLKIINKFKFEHQLKHHRHI